ncbi:MAG: zinc ribbon domain-containing protein [Methylotenera sp.]
MPIYDFQCTSCGHKDELMRKISEASTMVCPSCSKETFSKMLSAPSFQLSGTGWYASDFKDKKINKTQAETGNSETKSAEVVTKPVVTTAPVAE